MFRNSELLGLVGKSGHRDQSNHYKHDDSMEPAPMAMVHPSSSVRGSGLEMFPHFLDGSPHLEILRVSGRLRGYYGMPENKLLSIVRKAI